MVPPSIDTPRFAAFVIAFISACAVLTQCLVLWPSSCIVSLNRCPTSSQCGIPAGAPTYPVESTCLSFAITQPLLPLSHVALFATAFLISKKYSSQLGLI